MLTDFNQCLCNKESKITFLFVYLTRPFSTKLSPKMPFLTVKSFLGDHDTKWALVLLK